MSRLNYHLLRELATIFVESASSISETNLHPQQKYRTRVVYARWNLKMTDYCRDRD